jgi:hypothetical protein
MGGEAVSTLTKLEAELRISRLENMVGILVNAVDVLTATPRVSTFWEETRRDVLEHFPNSGIMPACDPVE